MNLGIKVTYWLNQSWNDSRFRYQREEYLYKTRAIDLSNSIWKWSTLFLIHLKPDSVMYSLGSFLFVKE